MLCKIYISCQKYVFTGFWKVFNKGAIDQSKPTLLHDGIYNGIDSKRIMYKGLQQHAPD